MPARTRARRHTPAPVSDSLDRLGDRIRKARVEAGLSQAKVGQPHFTRAYISALELGKIRPAMNSLEFLAEKLGKPLSYFVEDEEKERAQRERDVTVARTNQLLAQGAAQEALKEISAAETGHLSIPDRLAMRRVLGRAQLEAGDAGAALSTFTETLRGYESMGDAENAARTRSQLGRTLIALMNYAEAEGHLEAALKATADGTVRDPLFRVHVLHNLGVARYHRGAYQSALEHLERAVAESDEVGDPRWSAALFAVLGMSRRQVGDYEGAIASFLKSEALFERLNNETRVAEIRFETARTLHALGNKRRAAELLTSALEMARSTGASSLVVRLEVFAADLTAQEGDLSTARQTLEALLPRADASPDPRAGVVARLVLARVLAESDPPEAERILRQLADQLTNMSASDDLAEVYDRLSGLMARQGRSDEGLAFARQAYSTSLKRREVSK